MNVAKLKPHQIVIFAQSLGTAVAISLLDHLAERGPEYDFAGLILVASFTDVATLTATYKIGGIIPVLSPLSYTPKLLAFFTGFLRSTWLSKDRIAQYVRLMETDKRQRHYDITLIHAEDDSDIPCLHTETLFWYAVNATEPTGMSLESFASLKESKKEHYGAGG